MLTENDVVTAVALYLRNQKFCVDKECSTCEQGIDIEATNLVTGKRLLVECKGQTSSKKNSKRFGEPFTPSQVTVHISRAFYQAVKLRQQFSAEGIHTAIALPDDEYHREGIAAITGALHELGILVYLVDGCSRVSLV